MSVYIGSVKLIFNPITALYSRTVAVNDNLKTTHKLRKKMFMPQIFRNFAFLKFVLMAKHLSGEVIHNDTSQVVWSMASGHTVPCLIGRATGLSIWLVFKS